MDIEILRIPSPGGMILLVLPLLLGLFLFGKRVMYFECPLERYKGKNNSGKIGDVAVFHILLSMGLTLGLFALAYKNSMIEAWFEYTWIRIGSILLLWLFSFLVFGLFIEWYLNATDPEYRHWKSSERAKRKKN